MCEKQFNRQVDEQLSLILYKFLDEYNGNKVSNVGSISYSYYNKFIIESFNIPQQKRYSISQLSEILRKSEVDNIAYLITRYMDGLYLLAQLRKGEQFFYP